MRLKKIVIFNTAPFEKLILDFNDENISVLSGVNGTGKTTILSYIVDSFYELARKAFFNEFENKQNKFYRVSSSLYSIDASKPSIVYLRFSDGRNNSIDYVDIRGMCSEQDYLSQIQLDSPIPFSNLEGSLKDSLFVKYWSLSDSKHIRDKFDHEIFTYFPAYRYETPSYLNDPYKIELKFNLNNDFAGYLTNPIEVTSDIQKIADWCMDIVLDVSVQEVSAKVIFQQLSTLLTNILSQKLGLSVRLGIGQRNQGAVRLAITNLQGDAVYPSIFCMSSGELALLCLFGELLRQSDKLGRPSDHVNGIVLVDEIEKHLHITLQKEVLPALIKMFPDVQFIVSSHSPLLGLGLSEKDNLSFQILDLDNGGVSCSPHDNDIFNEAYSVFFQERENFAVLCNQLQEQIKVSTKPLLITEGKTDWKHLQAAMRALNITDLDISFYEFEDKMGDTRLLDILKILQHVSLTRKIIGIFDRDNFDALMKNDKEFTHELSSRKFVDMKHNVYAFAIPVVHEDIYGSYTSIEHYYKREHLTRKNSQGRRLFLGDEFYGSGFFKDEQYPYHTRCDQIQHKVKINGIIDQKVYDHHSNPEEETSEASLALSKNDFAQMILNRDDFARDFDFSAFSLIFDVIREICGQV